MSNENIRHDLERGKLLELLVAGGRGWLTYKMLYHLMADAGEPVSPGSLTFHLEYLLGGGYIEVQRRREMPGFRTDRSYRQGAPDEITQARITNKGIQLKDGRIEADPAVKFD